LTAPAATTAPGSAMYTVQDIYNRLETGAAGAKRAGAFVEPAAAPASTGQTLDDIMAKAPLLDAVNGATAAQVLTGKTFWGLLSGGWGTLTGTMPIQTLSAANDTVSAGYYAATTLSAVDTDLVSGNIRKDQTIFGVAGDANVVNTSSGDAVAANIALGKKAWADGAEVTGNKAGGVACTGSFSPLGRWCDNENGTVTDTSTGLVWLQDAGWGGAKKWVDSATWDDAQTRAGTLASGTAGLTDGSVAGDWRLPTKSELVALNTGTEFIRDTAMYKFTGVVASFYWSSTTYAANTASALLVPLFGGGVNNATKGNTYYVWPVRGGQ
ncbi:MAG: DUF1566 domain-containing protein, partial [Verrucomicrobia bacterium]|nr:DUF1566 domain-containing protein [Verrucomicrobiota bacterium]